jgi:hypothetical protein
MCICIFTLDAITKLGALKILLEARTVGFLTIYFLTITLVSKGEIILRGLHILLLELLESKINLIIEIGIVLNGRFPL